MFSMQVSLREGFGSWLGGIGRVLGRKGKEAGDELSAKDLPGEAQDDAEAALWQAMGWSKAEAAESAAVLERLVREGLEQ